MASSEEQIVEERIQLAKASRFDPLKAYIHHLCKRPITEWRPPPGGVFGNTVGLRDGTTMVSVILDRQGQFQTELFIAPPGLDHVEMHVHPGVDTIEVFVAGELELKSGGNAYHQKSVGQLIFENGWEEIPEACAHGAKILNGASFLSFQHWKRSEPTSVGHSFEVVKEESA